MEKHDKQEKPSIFQLVKDFADRTSMHGIGLAVNSKSLWKRIVWAILTLCGVGAAVYQLVDAVQDFYTYPVTTIVNLNHESHIQFPAITICNMNPVKGDSLPEDYKHNIVEFLETAACEGCSDQAIVHFGFRSIEQEYHLYANNLTDMLISCLFNGKQCSNTNFTYSSSSVSMMCYTFDLKNSTDRYTTRPGPQNGLILEMAIDYNDYTALSPQAGLKVIVHDQDEAPFPEDGGILVPPGVSTSIGIRKTVTIRLPPPYGECVTEAEDGSPFLSLMNEDGHLYTENSCRKACYQWSLIKSCNCCDITLPCNYNNILNILQITDVKKIDFCNITSPENNYCVFSVDNSYLDTELDCLSDCAPACSQSTYDMVVSTALFPSDPYLDVLMYHANRTVLKNMTFASEDEIRQFVSKNFLRLEIFYEKLDFMEIITTQMYSWSNILGNIGGFLGLWLGFSILTAFEIIELCIDILTLCVQRIRNKNMVKEKENQSEHL